MNTNETRIEITNEMTCWRLCATIPSTCGTPSTATCCGKHSVLGVEAPKFGPQRAVILAAQAKAGDEIAREMDARHLRRAGIVA